MPQHGKHSRAIHRVNCFSEIHKAKVYRGLVLSCSFYDLTCYPDLIDCTLSHTHTDTHTHTHTHTHMCAHTIHTRAHILHTQTHTHNSQHMTLIYYVLTKSYHWIYTKPTENRPKSLSVGRPKSDLMATSDYLPVIQILKKGTQTASLFEDLDDWEVITGCHQIGLRSPNR